MRRAIPRSSRKRSGAATPRRIRPSMSMASSVVADLIDMAVGRAQLTFQTLRLWSGDNGDALGVRMASAVRSRFYLRQVVEDRPGVLAEVATVLARHGVSIASVIQHE